MSILTLAIKYRPTTFSDVVEQEAIKIILQEQIRTGTFKNAYLFCGPAGCGKTTAARIFANDINGGKGSPIEIDAASNNGVDNVRNIIDNARRKSLDSEYKIYILDEAHMLSMGAWNALLKLLEEPPASSVFIMCTTDPTRIPATILSRVQRYDFSKISYDKIVQRLEYICRAEGEEIDAEANHAVDVIGYDDTSLQYIAKLSDGGMRDAITMLDKCISLSYDVTIQNVVKALGTVDYNTHFDFLYHMNVKNVSLAISTIENVYNSGKDIKQFIKQFQYFLVDVCKYQLFKSFKFVNIPELPEYKQKMDDEPLEGCLQVLEWCRQVNADIKWEPNAKAMIEASMLVFLFTQKGEEDGRPREKQTSRRSIQK